jgi:hypothetical protein
VAVHEYLSVASKGNPSWALYVFIPVFVFAVVVIAVQKLRKRKR